MTSYKCQLFYKILILTLFAFYFTEGENMDSHVVAARIESCRGCRLNRLPDVKKFVFEDVPLYKNVVFKPIQGASPELVLLNTDEQEVERIDLAPLTREECNNLLAGKGFSKKDPDTAPNPLHNDF